MENIQPSITATMVPARYAGFWLRFIALLIDSIILGLANAMILTPVFTGILAIDAPEIIYGENFALMMTPYYLLSNTISIVGGFLYYALMESSSTQGTLGKMALGLVVTDLDGKPISFVKATGRYFGKILSALIFLIGYIMAAFTSKKQALHDMLAGSLVLKK